jgi:hypothetical protein
MSTPSLGDMLRKAIDRNTAETERLRRENLENERGQLEREEHLVRELFATAKHVFTSAILAGNEVVPVRVGNGENNGVSHLTNMSSGDINAPSNRFYSFWKDFIDWADEQGLVAVWQFEDDGVGKVDWRLLSVAPKP